MASFKKESSTLESIIERLKQFVLRTVGTAKCRNEIASRITRGRFETIFTGKAWLEPGPCTKKWFKKPLQSLD